MKKLVLFAIGHSRNGDSPGFLKERFLREDLSMHFYLRPRSLEIPIGFYFDYVLIEYTSVNQHYLITKKVTQ